MSKFGIMVGEARAKLGVTLNYVCMRVGCSTSFLCDVEHGRRSVSPEVAVLLAKALSHSPEIAEALTTSVTTNTRRR